MHNFQDFLTLTLITFPNFASFYILTIYVSQVYDDIKRSRQRVHSYKKWKLREIQSRSPFCHPAWPIEAARLRNEESTVKRAGKASVVTGWTVVEVLVVILTTGMLSSKPA